MEREPSSSQDDADDSISRLLGQWGGEGTVEERLASHLGADSLPEVELEREEPESERVSALLDALHLRGGAFGRYRVKDEIGRGGMGVVLRLWDSELKRHLAMKLALAAREGNERDPRKIARFLEEAQVTAQLDHPGIVPVHELGLDGEGRVYFTMRLVKGRSLAVVFDLAREGSEGWTQARVLGVLIRACEAVAYAHSRGVIHRDLKPANIMVGAFGEVYVMDWGLARVLARDEASVEQPSAGVDADSSAIVADVRRASTPDSPLATGAGHVLGTPAYMAPEQARGELDALGPRSELYALGAILYEFLAAAAPYAEHKRKLEPAQIVARVLEGPPRTLRALAHAAPSELIAICEMAMAREPGERYSGALELIEDLRAFQEHRPGRAWSDSPLRWATKLVRRRPTGAIGVIALALAAATLLTFMRVREVEAKRAVSEAERQVFEDIVKLSKFESALTPDVEDATWQESQRVAHTRKYALAAGDVIASLLSCGVDVASAADGEDLAEQVRNAGTERLRNGLVEELFLLAKYIGLSGIAEAVHRHDRRDATADDLAEWDAMFATYPDLSRTWPMLAPALRSLSGESIGVKALERYTQWIVDRVANIEFATDPLDNARVGELDFASMAIDQMVGLEAAGPFLSRALRERPDNVWANMRAARLAMANKDLSAARAYATAAVALWPSSATANHVLGVALFESGDLDGARVALERGLAVDPHSVFVLQSLGEVLQASGQLEESQAMLERAVAEAHDDPELLYTLAIVLDERAEATSNGEMAERSIALFQRVTELHPNWWDGFYRLGRALQLVMRLDESIAAFDAGLALHPKGRDLRVSKAESLAQLGRHEEAVALCLELLSDFHDDANGLHLFDLLLEGAADDEHRADYRRRLDETLKK